MKITVFLASSLGNSPLYQEKAKELGRWIAENGHTLVYGGSRIGLMGVIAHAALDAGGKVIGVEPQFFIDKELQLDGLTELIVTPDMMSRKAKLLEMGEAFIVFPGGLGTLEEFADLLCAKGLKHILAPCFFYNIDGFFNPIADFLKTCYAAGYVTKEKLQGVSFVDSIEAIEKAMCEFRRFNRSD